MRHRRFLPSLVAVLVSFAVASGRAQTPQFKLLHVFTHGSDGAYPSTPLVIDQSGNLFGATVEGGSPTDCSTNGCGNAYELSQLAGHWGDRVLFEFSNSNGFFPEPIGPLVLDAKGNIYGTHLLGGDPICNCGGVFQLTRSGGVWTENILYNFLGGSGDGASPISGLVQDKAGNLYGATEGGFNGPGSIFELTPRSDGTWAYNVIHVFGSFGDGASPYGSLNIDASGNLYGTTSSGGIFGYGVVFKLAPSGGAFTETTLYNFSLDFGSAPQADGVMLGGDGNLYGATIFGGEHGLGTIYKLTPTTGFWNQTVLHTFTGNNDGAYPYGGLIADQTGALYGTAGAGGIYGYGTVFKLKQGVHGQWNEIALHSFAGTDGSQPGFGVVFDQLGSLYGVAGAGGTYGVGVAFKIVP